VVLVDVRSSGSRLLREYTLLLDPPAFQTQPAPAAPVVAPSVGDARGTTVQPVQPAQPAQPAPRPVAPAPAPQAPAAPAPRPVAAAPAAGGGGAYTVRRGDTLSSIAGREYGADESARGMIAIYRANPQAFGGNINLLQAGATLEIPEQGALAAITRSEAGAEVRSQMAAWRNASPAPQETAEARLRLVPPGEPAGSGDSTTPEGGTGTEAPAPATADRALSVESADLARLQGAPETAPVEPETAAP